MAGFGFGLSAGAGGMADALHEIIAQQGGMTPEAAAEFVKQLKRDNRYQRDVY